MLSSGFAGESQNFDGNGQYVRFQTGGGANLVSTGSVAQRRRRAVRATQTRRRLARARRGRPSKPPFNSTKSVLPEPGPRREQREDRARPMSHAIRKHLRDFIAILVLFVLGAWAWPPTSCPTSASTCRTGCRASARSSTRVNAQFQTAQAVVPGQGQTVDIAGVKIGEVGGVELKDGRAVVEMQIQEKYKPIYRDATHPPTPEDRPEGHDPRAEPGPSGGGRAARGRHGAGVRTRCRT